MTSNVIPFKPPELAYPDYWPQLSYDAVGAALLRNVPEKMGKNEYHYVLKADVGGFPASIIIKPNGTVMYNVCDRTLHTERIKNWVDRHIAPLRQLSDLGASFTACGKLIEEKGRSVFCVYYLIDDEKRIHLDDITISERLKLNEGFLSEVALSIPASHVVPMSVDKFSNTYTCKALLNTDPAQGFIGFPVHQTQARDGNQKPCLLTTWVHMQFMAFYYPPRPRLRVIDNSVTKP